MKRANASAAVNPALRSASGKETARLRPMPKRSPLAWRLVWGWLVILIAVGRLGEIVPGLSAVPLAKIALGIGALILVARWKQLQQISPSVSPILWSGIWLVFIAAASILYSVWPGRSLIFILNTVPLLTISVVFIYKLSTDWNASRSLQLAFVYSGAALALVTIIQFTGGRAATGSTYDPNDLAYVLVTIFPIAVGFSIAANSRGKKLVFFSVAAAMVAAALLTSSRGGLLGILVAMFAILYDSGKVPHQTVVERRRKQAGAIMRMVGAAIVLCCVALASWPFLPQETKERLSSIVRLEGDYNLNADNKTGRSQIWTRGVVAGLARPIGYGVDAYPMVDLRTGGKMNTAHSSVVLVFVELGALGLLLFLRLYYLCWRRLAKAREQLPDSLGTRGIERSVALRMMQASVLGNLVAGLFLSLAYSMALWVLVALVAGAIATSSDADSGASR